MGQIKEQTLSGVKWSAIERFSVQGVSFIINLILARILSPADFGVIGIVAIFLSISQSFIDSGFSNALIRQRKCSEIDFSTVFYFNIVVGLFFYCLLYFSSEWIASFFSNVILEDIIKVLSISVLINSLIVVHIAILTIRVDFRTQAKASLIAVIISGLLGVSAAFYGFGVWALVIQQISNGVINALLLCFLLNWKPMFVFSWNSFKLLFSFGSKILISGLIHQVYTQMTTISIGRFYSASDLGNYSRGYQFAMFPSSNITSVLSRVTFPVFSKIQDDDEHLTLVYRKYIRLTSMIIIFLMMLLAALAKPLILVFLTEKWAESIAYLQIFSFALMFNHVNQINLNLLQVKGRSDLYLRLEIIKKTISIVILLIAIPFGVIAICLSAILYSQLAIIFNTYYTGKLFNLGYWLQFKDFTIYVLLSAVACFPAYILSCTTLNCIVILIIASITSLLIYISLLLAVNDTLFKSCILNLIKVKILNFNDEK